MGDYPNPIARSMITTRSGIVAVVVPDVVNTHCTTIITALH
jgi:LacI family transcriptional regulator